LLKTSAEETLATPRPGVMSLLGDLAGAAVDLAQNTVELAACEARVVVRRLAVRAGFFFVGLVCACLGLLLVLGGAALLLVEAGLPAWAAFMIVGVVVVALGAVTAVRAVKLLGDRDLAFPATLAEFRTDVETLRRSRIRATTETS
jgi:uncharacterized membrane protein YqjE